MDSLGTTAQSLLALAQIAAAFATVGGLIRAAGRWERRRCGMLLDRPADTGDVLRVSCWSGGVIDGTDTSDSDTSLRVHECEHGWLVERRFSFAGSAWLWFPCVESRGGDVLVREHATWVRVVESPAHRVEVRRRLGESWAWRPAKKR